jgi:hypothetical protein
MCFGANSVWDLVERKTNNMEKEEQGMKDDTDIEFGFPPAASTQIDSFVKVLSPVHVRAKLFPATPFTSGCVTRAARKEVEEMPSSSELRLIIRDMHSSMLDRFTPHTQELCKKDDMSELSQSENGGFVKPVLTSGNLWSQPSLWKRSITLLTYRTCWMTPRRT